jgi:hypothetical protein
MLGRSCRLGSHERHSSCHVPGNMHRDRRWDCLARCSQARTTCPKYMATVRAGSRARNCQSAYHCCGFVALHHCPRRVQRRTQVASQCSPHSGSRLHTRSQTARRRIVGSMSATTTTRMARPDAAARGDGQCDRVRHHPITVVLTVRMWA